MCTYSKNNNNKSLTFRRKNKSLFLLAITIEIAVFKYFFALQGRKGCIASQDLAIGSSRQPSEARHSSLPVRGIPRNGNGPVR